MKIGVLGGGQLGRMFIQAALNYPVEIYVLDPDTSCPCKDICNNFTLGDFNDYDTVLAFGEKVDVISIEIEHVNIAALKELKKKGKRIIPDPNVLEIIQDKGLQKEFYKKHNIPTAPFALIQYSTELHKHQQLLPAFQKLRKGGYDGKGVVRLDSLLDIDKVLEEKSVLEELANIKKELSVIVAKNETEIVTYPVVEMVVNKELNQLDYLLSPADIDFDYMENAIEIAMKVVESFNSPGIYAVELFYNKDNTIWVNEVAPRVHNSGHATIEGNITSQFDQMLRVILNYPLGKTDALETSVMLNIVGEKGCSGFAYYKGLEKILGLNKTYVHMYGKPTTKPGRKMGHITFTGNNVEEIMPQLSYVKKNLKVTSI